MAESLKQSTDAELEAVCVLRPWEQALHNLSERLNVFSCLIGCAGPLLALLLAAFYTVIYEKPFNALSYSLFCVLLCIPLCLCSALENAARFRSRHHRTELQTRYGAAPLRACVLDASERLKAEDAPEWILFLESRALPHGGHYFIEIVLQNTPSKLGRVRAYFVPYSSASKPTEQKSGMAELRDEDLQELSGLLQNLQTSAVEDPSDFVFDGMPCEIAVLRKRPFHIWKANCNLAGVPPEKETHPTPVLLRLALRIGCAVLENKPTGE